MSNITEITVGGTTYNLRDNGAVRFDEEQNLTNEQKAQARANIDIPDLIQEHINYNLCVRSINHRGYSIEAPRKHVPCFYPIVSERF